MTTQEAADTLLKIADRDQILKLIAEIEKAADANNGSVKTVSSTDYTRFAKELE